MLKLIVVNGTVQSNILVATTAVYKHVNDI